MHPTPLTSGGTAEPRKPDTTALPSATIPIARAGRSPTGPVGGLAVSAAARQGLPAWMPLRFLLTGVGAAAVFGLLLPWLLPEALSAPQAPHILALVHLATLGWLTMVVLGALQQLLPVILVTPLRGSLPARLAYPVYAAGVLLLISGFALNRPPLLAVGGSLVVLAVLALVGVLGVTMRHATTHPLSLRYLVAALGYLVVVVALGLTLALNLQFGFLGAALTHLLLAHVLLGVVGWLTTMLMGVSYTLARLFALAHRHDDCWGRIVFVLLNVGVMGLALGFTMSWPVAVLALPGACLVAAVWLYAADFVRLLRGRLRKALEPTQYCAAAGAAYLVVLVPGGLVVALVGWGDTRLVTALGLAALVGWLGQNTLGYLYKIVPFLVWQDRFGARVGRERVPLMRDLVRASWAWASFWTLNGALVGVILALLLGWEGVAQVCCVPLGLALVLAAVNVGAVPLRAQRGVARPPTPLP